MKRNLICFLFLVIIYFSISKATTMTFWKTQYFYSDPLHDEKLRNEITLKLMETTKKRIFIIGSSSVSEGIGFKTLNQSEDKEFFRFGIPLSDPLTILEWQDKFLAKNPDTIIYLINPLHRRQLEKKKKQEWLEKFTTYYQYRNSFYNIEKKMLLDKVGLKKWNGTKEYEYYSKRVSLDNIRSQAYEWMNLSREEIDQQKKLFMDFALKTLANGTKLIVIERPNYSLVDPNLMEVGRDEMNWFLNLESKRYGFKFIPTDQLPKFEDQDFNDFSHLSKSGREKLTNFIGENHEF